MWGKLLAKVFLCTEGDINLLKNDEYWDPHAIAGLLKLYLRELPTSLLTRELQQRFLGVVGTYNVLLYLFMVDRNTSINVRPQTCLIPKIV